MAPGRTRLAAWRAVVDRGVGLEPLDDPAFVATFGHVGGDRLSRVPPGFPKDHPRAELLTLKDVTFGRHLSDDEAMSSGLPDIIADDSRPPCRSSACSDRCQPDERGRHGRRNRGATGRPRSDGTIEPTRLSPTAAARARPPPWKDSAR